jgi:putative selenium metabolism protein SsnA
MLIVGCNLITWEQPNQILEGYGLRILDGRIAEIGRKEDLIERFSGEERLDAGGQYVMPGNICAHTHFYGAFSRGMAIPGSAPDGFPQILEKLWWPLDRVLTHEDVRFSTLVCLVDAIKHGTTTLIDHHASPSAIAGSLDFIAEAVEEAGVRASLCYEVTDRNGEEGARAGIDENVRFIQSIKNRPTGRLGGTFGLHAGLTLSDQTLRACREACPQDIGFHIHVAEHPVDEYDSLEKTGLRVVDRLDEFGILGPKTIIAHAVHIDPQEIEIIARSHSWVSHQPRSNMNNAVGLPAVEGMLRAGIRVCLGNDGFSNAMWEEWKAAYLAHKLLHRDPRRMGGNVVVNMAVYNNAALAQDQLNCAPLGVIKPGAEADLIFVDYHPFTPLTAGNLPWHILFGFNESMITTTLVNGKVLMKDRMLLTLDEEKIAYHARKLSGQVWQRYENEFSMREGR